MNVRHTMARALLASSALAGTLVWSVEPTAAQCGGCTSYQVVNKVVYDQVPVTTYRLEYETVMEEQQVTTLRPEWTEEVRERRYTVAKPVTETATREERYLVRRPVQETSYREEAYDRTTFVTETEMRQEKYLVQRPVVETQLREQQHVVQRAVQETVMQQQAYTAYQPVQNTQTQYVDQGQYVTAYQPLTQARNRLWHVPAGGAYATDPATGQTTYYRGGLRWVPTQGPTMYQPTQVYMPNVVAQQVTTTNYQPVQMTQQVPVTVNRLVNEVVTQQIPVQVQRMETVEEVRDVPVQVQRPVTERIVNKVPVQSVRWEEEEHVRQVPYTVQRIEYEEQVEQIPVRTCRYVSETKAVQVPRTVGKWVAYTSTRLQPRVVTMRVALTPTVTVIDSPLTLPAPSLRLPPASVQTNRPATNGATKKTEAAGGQTTTERPNAASPSDKAGEASKPADATTSGGVEAQRKATERRSPGAPAEPGDSGPSDNDKLEAPRLNRPDNATPTSLDRHA